MLQFRQQQTSPLLVLYAADLINPNRQTKVTEQQLFQSGIEPSRRNAAIFLLIPGFKPEGQSFLCLRKEKRISAIGDTKGSKQPIQNFRTGFCLTLFNLAELGGGTDPVGKTGL